MQAWDHATNGKRRRRRILFKYSSSKQLMTFKMERKLCGIKKSDVCETMSVLSFDTNFDQNVDSDAKSKREILEDDHIERASNTTHETIDHDEKEDTQTSTMAHVFNWHVDFE